MRGDGWLTRPFYRLQQWEKEINDLENPRVYVENNADLEGPPRHMTYVTVSKVNILVHIQ